MTNLKKKRLEKGITRKELAKRADVKLGTLKHYEQGTRLIDNANLYTIVNISSALNCFIWEICEDKEKFYNLENEEEQKENFRILGIIKDVEK